MIHRWLRRIVEVEERETRAMLLSFAAFFSLLAGWSLLRPIRDETAVAGGTKNVPWLFSAVFVGTLVAVPLYSFAVARLPRVRVVPAVYHCFAATLGVLFIFWHFHVSPLWTGRVFFVWASVANLFITSAMWSVMADTWRSEQGQRLFGFIAAGASAGGVLGPLLTTALVGPLGASGLLLVGAVAIEICALCVRLLARETSPTTAATPQIGGGLLAGIRHTFASPYLLAIAACVLLYALTSTFLYSQQTLIFETLVPDRAERTRLFALQDLIVNLSLIAVQAAVTGRVVRWLGVGAALAALPVYTAGGFGLLLVAPSVAAVLLFQGSRRVVHFAFDRPAREVLFTVVPREDKYKAKSFIDTVVYRGGDALGGWLYAALGVVAMPAAIPLALVWLAATVTLARRHAAKDKIGATP